MMFRLTPIIALVAITLTSYRTVSNPYSLVSECDVVEVYEGIEAKSNTKVLTTSGDLEAADVILVQSSIELGTYKIDITRKGSNIYKIEGTDYYIETRYCYEYATSNAAILIIESNYGYSKGKVFFE